MRKGTFIISILLSTIYIGCKNGEDYSDDKKLCELLAQMKIDDQSIRKMDLLKNGSQRQKDSLWKIQEEIDERNTEKLIDITKKRGWVSKKGLNCRESISPVLIFRHSNEKFHEEIKMLIEIESKAGRMESGDFMFIENHLNGRPDFDFGVEK